MKFYKRIWTALLVLCLTLSLLTGCNTSDASPSNSTQPTESSELSSEPTEELTESEKEIQKAIDLGLVPDVLEGNYAQQISYGEFCSLLDCYFETAVPKAIDVWEKNSANYHYAEEKMTLMEGILVLFQAAQDSKVDAVGYQYGIPFPDGQWLDYPLLGDIEAIDYYDEVFADSELYSWVNDLIYPNVAVLFASRFSYGNGKTYFDYNDEFTFDFDSPLTKEVAIKAVKRLYETAIFTTSVPTEEATCGVTKETIALGEEMPVVTYDNLPNWHGYVLTTRSSNLKDGSGKYYNEEEIKLVAEQGFNLIRVQMDYRDLFEGLDTTMVFKEMLANMDELVNWCAKYGLHVCFDLTDMTGFTTDMNNTNDDLFSNVETQERFQNIWRFMAVHYQDVPPNLLSFLLLNEPHDSVESALTDENYSDVMRMAIDAIREVSPDRLIIVSTLGANFTAPAEGLSDAGVAFGCSAYPLSDGAKQWPAYYIGKNHQQGAGDLVLDGSFPANTQIEITVMQYCRSSLTLYAGNEAVLAFDVDGEIFDGTGLTVKQGDAKTQWAGSNGGIYGSYTITMKISESCNELRLQNQNDDYYELMMLSVITPEHTYTLNGAWDFDLEWQENLMLTLLPDGSISSEKENGLVLRGKDAIREMLEEYLAYRERTGAEFIVLESGFMPTISIDAAANCAEDWFSVLEEYQIPWINYGNEYCPFMDKNKADLVSVISDPNSGEVTWYRQGTIYEDLSDRYIVDTKLMEVFQAHMTSSH